MKILDFHENFKMIIEICELEDKLSLHSNTDYLVFKNEKEEDYSMNETSIQIDLLNRCIHPVYFKIREINPDRFTFNQDFGCLMPNSTDTFKSKIHVYILLILSFID